MHKLFRKIALADFSGYDEFDGSLVSEIYELTRVSSYKSNVKNKDFFILTQASIQTFFECRIHAVNNHQMISAHIRLLFWRKIVSAEPHQTISV